MELTDQLRFILDLGVAIAAALLGGVVSVRLGQPAIVGYLLAGIAIGPFTPGFVGDVGRITELAELGVELRAAFVVGACLSISSTLVVLKSLIDRGELDSLHGRTAIGWAIVQDIVTILFIVAL